MKNSSRIPKFAISLMSLVFVACASKDKAVPCPSVEEEPISVCRAREKCKNQNSSVGLGVGIGMGNFGFGVGTSQSTTRYESCLDIELTEQKVQARDRAVAPQ